tara:strand:- start:1108 stop:2328 length:1221 start_codon:yes stop_codon:yes gene_type:complete
MDFKNSLFKTIGFFEYKTDLYSNLNKLGFTSQDIDSDTKRFLKNSYYTEFLNLMFGDNKNGVSTYIKNFDYELTLAYRESKVIINQVQVHLFNDSFKTNQIAIFSIEYGLLDKSIIGLSDSINDLKNKNSKIIFNSKEYLLDEFISKEILNTESVLEDSSVTQFSGSRYKNFLIVDVDVNNESRDDLLYELGTSSKIDTIKNNTLDAPSKVYVNKILENKISCFNNYDCLTLLNSFTVVGNENFNREHIQTFTTWNTIYFSIYIFNLYIKCCLQVILNDFTSEPMKKRNEFNAFYNKYFFKKISFNFLPNELNKGMASSLEIEEDVEFIRTRLETLATQVNEKQQSKQEFLLLCLSAIALLETPLHIEGIRQIIGIENLFIYNSFIYPSVILTFFILLILKFKEKI